MLVLIPWIRRNERGLKFWSKLHGCAVVCVLTNTSSVIILNFEEKVFLLVMSSIFYLFYLQVLAISDLNILDIGILIMVYFGLFFYLVFLVLREGIKLKPSKIMGSMLIQPPKTNIIGDISLGSLIYTGAHRRSNHICCISW